jgi:hypothetical protein
MNAIFSSEFSGAPGYEGLPERSSRAISRRRRYASIIVVALIHVAVFFLFTAAIHIEKLGSHARASDGHQES